MKIPPKIKHEVEAVISQTIPDPLSKEYDVFIEALRKSHPAEAEKLERSYDFSSFGDPFSKAEAVSNRRKQRDGLLHTLFMRRTASGRWTLSRGKLLSWGGALLTGFFALLLVNIAWKPRVVAGGAPVVNAQETGDVQAVAPDEQTSGDQGAATQNEVDPFAGYQSSALVSDKVTTPTTVAQSATVQNPTLPSDPRDGPTLPTEQRSTTPETATQQASTTPEPTTTPVLGLNVFAGGGTGTVSLKGDEAAKVVSLRSASGSTANTFGSSQTLAQSPSLFVFSGNAMAQTEQPASAFALPNNADAEPRVTGDAAVQPAPNDSAKDTFAQVGQDTPVLPVAGESGDANVQPETTSLEYQSGDSLAASLELGLVFVEGANEASGVVAKGEDGSVWIGDALLERSGRVTISFDQVVVNGRTFDVQASALAEDGYAGLNATTRETTPSLASDLARGAMRGVADYVEQLGKSKTVVLQGNTPVVASQNVPIESSVLGSVSQLFAPPQGNEQQAIVRVSELAPGTSFRLLMIEAN